MWGSGEDYVIGRGNSEYKGPEVECPWCIEDHREASVSETE